MDPGACTPQVDREENYISGHRSWRSTARIIGEILNIKRSYSPRDHFFQPPSHHEHEFYSLSHTHVHTGSGGNWAHDFYYR